MTLSIMIGLSEYSSSECFTICETDLTSANQRPMKNCQAVGSILAVQ